MTIKVFYVWKKINFMLWKLILFMCIAQGYTKNEKEKIVQTSNIESIEGHTAKLPCPLMTQGSSAAAATSSSFDKINMVLWFRDDAGIPLYSFDVREKQLSQAMHWSAPQVFGTRAYFVTNTEATYLELTDVKRHDQGVYRCRVDYRDSQTRSFRYNLTVIILPEQPVVLDRWGSVVNSSTIGPKEEGDDIMLTCRVVGGRPQPQVRWLVNGELVDEEYEHNSGNVLENRLLWPAIKRDDLHSVFTCQAVNTILIAPREKRLVLDIYLKPVNISITNSSLPLIADRKYEIVCETHGSRPDAVITWLKAKKPLKRYKEQNVNNKTVSILNFIPTKEDHDKTLTCHAENPNVSGLYLESVWQLNVLYPPVVRLELGSTLAENDIKEGDDVYFECKIYANPQWRKLTWLRNSVALPQNTSTKIVRSNQSLVLQKVTRFSAGKFQCSALNSEGETVSNEIVLLIKFVPLCKTDKIVVIGATKSESLEIVCEIVTHPVASKFHWKFENSEEMIEVEHLKYINNGSSSILHFTPHSDHDFGTLSCWGTNEIGTQSEPCIFQIILAGLPTTVINCSWNNLTETSSIVKCMPGYDGGLPQAFVLEIISMKHKTSKFNVTNPHEPYFKLDSVEKILSNFHNIDENDVLKVFVYSKNAKGRTAGVYITEFYVGTSQLQNSSVESSSTTSLLIVGVVLILIVCLVVFAQIFFKRRKSQRSKDHRKQRYSKECKSTLLNQDNLDRLKFKSWRFNGKRNIKMSKIEMTDDEQDPDLISFPKAASNNVPEELIPMRTNTVFLPNKRSSIYQEDENETSDTEVNCQEIHDLLLTTRVPESCV